MSRVLPTVCSGILLMVAPLVFAVPTPEPLDERGLMTLLKDHMQGQRVIAVGVGDIEHGVHFDEAAYAKATGPPGRLQIISAAVSADLETYIPFAVRNAWVIAPATRTEVRTDLTGVPDIEAEGGGLLLDQFVLSLAPASLKAAGSDEGIIATRLPPESQALLARILKPPLNITQSREGYWTDLNGKKREGWVHDPLGKITEPLDLSRLRLRARLWIESAAVHVERSEQRLGQQRRHERPGVIIGGWRNVEAPVAIVAGNHFKPSDLDGKALTQPVGASGVMSLSDALQQVEKVTGLTLYPGAYGKAPVFVGSPDIQSGEVLDGIRLAITGAWRKVGKGYVLCWDRRGLAALNQTLAETSGDLVSRINGIAETTGSDLRWLDIATLMPFAADDPLALTDEQRLKVYGDLPAPREGEIRHANGEGVPFEEMTPEQQAYLEACGTKEQMAIRPPGEPGDDWPEPERRPFTTEDVHSARLGAVYAPQVALELDLPGFGWVRTVLDYSQSLAPYRIRQLRQEAADRDAQAAKNQLADAPPTPPQRPQPPPGTFAPKPFSIAAPDRGVMVGPMRPAQLNALARQMKSKRFTTLFYPVLYEGYSTFASKAFPAHPDLKGENGMATAVAAASSNGLKLIGYLSPVAWRSQRNASHWLENHPDWLDRDPLGRTRLEWLKARVRRKPPLPSGLRYTDRCDYVRPADPEVIRRLETLVSEFTRTKAAGLVLLEWRRQSIEEGGRPVSPPLGFALGDRVALLSRTGYDPLDAMPVTTWADSVTVYPPDHRLLGINGFRMVGINGDGLQGLRGAPATDLYTALADRLLQRVRSLRKDWTTYLVDPVMPDPYRPELPGSPAVPPTPKADVLLAEWAPGAARDGRIVPDWPWDEADAGGWIPDEVRNHSSLLFRDWSENGLSRGAKMIVMDFRLRPERAAEVLKFVR